MSEVVASLQGLAMVAAIWCGMAIWVYVIVGAVAHWKEIESMTIELDDEVANAAAEAAEAMRDNETKEDGK